jgi:DNA-binding LacI/PurR family transcriptional regulator
MRWKRKRRGFRGTLAFITDDPPEERLPSDPDSRIFQYAQEMAHHLGYEIEWFPLDKGSSPKALSRQLYYRGITGVLISRLDSKLFLNTFDWDKFVAVQCNYGHFDFPCHQIVLERYTEVITAWKKAVETGHRRIGLVLMHEDRATDIDLRVGAMEYCQRQLFPHLPALPLTYFIYGRGWNKDLRQMTATVRKLNPDALILFNGYYASLCRALPAVLSQKISLIDLMIMEGDEGDVNESGMLEDLKPVARAAVGLVDSLLRCGQFGYPERRQVITLSKQWVDGSTLIRSDNTNKRKVRLAAR